MGETSVITPPAGVEEKGAEKITEDRIIKNVPKAYQVRTKKLIRHLKYYTRVSWNAKCAMVVDGKTLPGSNIAVLVHDIIGKTNTKSIKLEESLSSNNPVKLNFLEVSLEMLKSRES